MANSQGEGNAFATPRSSTWIVLNCILFVIVLDSCCWWLDKGLSRVFKGQTGFEFRVLRFRDLGALFSSFGCFVFKIWVLQFRDLGGLFSRFGCFVLRPSFSSASFSKLPFIFILHASGLWVPPCFDKVNVHSAQDWCLNQQLRLQVACQTHLACYCYHYMRPNDKLPSL